MNCETRLTRALDILLEASQALARAELDETVLPHILQTQVRRFLPETRIHILIFHQAQAQLFAWDESGQAQPPAWYETPAAHSIMGWLKETQCALLVRDFEQEWEKLPARPSYNNPQPPQSAIFAPMLVGNQTLGAISVQSQQPHSFNHEHLQLVRILANQAAAVLGAGRLLTTERRRANQLQTLAQVTRSVVSILDLDELTSQVVDIIAEAFGYYHVQLFVLEPESKRLLFKASSDCTTHELWRRKARYELLSEGIVGWVASHGRLKNVGDVTQSTLYIPDDPRLLTATRSEIAVALKLEDEVLGVLDVQSTQPNDFSAEDEFILVALADAVALAIDNARLYASAIEQQRLSTELQVAREIQIGFLPEQLPQHPGYEFAARWEPAREIGGDFYDFIPLQNERLGLVIADVADKGIPAALYMALSRTTMRLVAASDPSPATALQRVNTAILETTYSDLFVTMFYIILDPVAHLVRYASGGHGLALLVREHEIISLRSKGMALGILPQIRIEEQWRQLEPNDVIILYTDGVTDAVNEKMEDYGRERFYARIRALWGCSAAEMAAGIHEDVRAWKGAAPRYDDFTLVVIRRVS
jgi:serine phosphatase RsbU (regulator of sigma subunit)